MIVRAIVAGLLVGMPVRAMAADLKVATWNLEWLTDRSDDLPADAQPKRPEDIVRLRGYAAELNADVIAIQEVDGAAIAYQVFPSDRYSIHLTHDPITQRVGIVVRRGIPYSVNPDLTALDPRPAMRLRSGADITLHLASGPLRVLAVHLKSDCASGSLARSRRSACAILREQLPALQRWIAQRQQEGVPFILLGDFNRHMDGRDQFFVALQQAGKLTRATEGRASPCWGSENFIDHILAGGPAREWMQRDTLQVLVYRETAAEWRERLSDHCPVAVNFRLPD